MEVGSGDMVMKHDVENNVGFSWNNVAEKASRDESDRKFGIILGVLGWELAGG